jgi:hypothetical protein
MKFAEIWVNLQMKPIMCANLHELEKTRGWGIFAASMLRKSPVSTFSNCDEYQDDVVTAGH